jgi:hypothetical protein
MTSDSRHPRGVASRCVGASLRPRSLLILIPTEHRRASRSLSMNRTQRSLRLILFLPAAGDPSQREVSGRNPRGLHLGVMAVRLRVRKPSKARSTTSKEGQGGGLRASYCNKRCSRSRRYRDPELSYWLTCRSPRWWTTWADKEGCDASTLKRPVPNQLLRVVPYGYRLPG